MIVYFVRSGESQDDQHNLFQHPSSPLSALGEQEVALLAKHFVDHEFDAVLSSPLLRARQTAEMLVSDPHTIVYDKELSEIRHPSELVGEKKDDPAFATTRYLLKSKWSYPAWHYSDEENFQDVKRRAERVLKQLITSHEEKLLVVSHGHFLTMLFLVMALGKEVTADEYRHFDTFTQMSHAGVTECVYENKVWKMKLWSDTEHLESDRETTSYIS